MTKMRDEDYKQGGRKEERKRNKQTKEERPKNNKKKKRRMKVDVGGWKEGRRACGQGGKIRNLTSTPLTNHHFTFVDIYFQLSPLCIHHQKH